jgi:glucokinase
MKNIRSIGIDFGGTSIKFGVVSGKEIIATSPRILTKNYPVPGELICAIADKVNQLKSEHENIVAIGCGVPGFVDFLSGTIHNLTNVPGWINIPLKQELETRTGLATVIENDANAMAIAEWKLGAAKGCNHAICLTLGTGVGAGVIANGAIVRGAQYLAGELGQTSIHYAGRKGNYNNPGALESYVGNNDFAADTQAEYEAAGIVRNLKECSPEQLAEAAENGCHIALKAWDGFAQKLATSLASTCWLLNPEIIVIGGGLANAGDILFAPMIKHLHAQLSEPFKDHLQVVPAEFSNNAGILGAAVLAIQEIEDYVV